MVVSISFVIMLMYLGFRDRVYSYSILHFICHYPNLFRV